MKNDEINGLPYVDTLYVWRGPGVGYVEINSDDPEYGIIMEIIGQTKESESGQCSCCDCGKIIEKNDSNCVEPDVYSCLKCQTEEEELCRL